MAEGDEHIPLAANVLGTIGTDRLWCIQLVPQIWVNWRTKKTEGLPSSMMFLWAISAVPFGTYNIVQDFNIPLQIQPQLFCALAIISWSQILHYRNGWSRLKSALYGLATAAVFGGVQTALILTLTPLYDRNTTYPILIIGIIAAIFLAAGLLPPYWELWKRRGRVVGINFVFLTLDFLGAVFSLCALVAQAEFDVLGGVLYIICMTLEIGIFTSHAVWCVRTYRLRRQLRAEGTTYDEVLEGKRARGEGWEWEDRRMPRWVWRREGRKSADEDVEQVDINQTPVMTDDAPLDREAELTTEKVPAER